MGDGVTTTRRHGTTPSTMRLCVVATLVGVTIVVGFAIDTWKLESPVSLPAVPGWLGPLALVVFVLQTFKRDRRSFKHLLLTAFAVAVAFASGLGLVALAAL